MNTLSQIERSFRTQVRTFLKAAAEEEANLFLKQGAKLPGAKRLKAPAEPVSAPEVPAKPKAAKKAKKAGKNRGGRPRATLPKEQTDALVQAILNAKEPIAAADIVSKTGIDKKLVTRELKHLVASGMLKTTGQRRGMKYIPV